MTEHTYRFRKWASLKANAILNTMEIAFWFVVVIITFITNTQRCSGMSCVISWVVGLLAAILTYVSLPLKPKLCTAPAGRQLKHLKAYTQHGNNMKIARLTFGYSALAVLTSVTSIKDFRHFKKLGVLRGSNIHGGYNSNSKNQHARI